MELVGSLINRRYRVIREIARGGMSIIYLAEDVHSDNQRVAIKSLAPKYLNLNLEDSIRLSYEAKTASHFNHPNIVKIYEFIKTGDAQLLVMEHIDGFSLSTYLQTHRPSLEDGLYIIKNIALSLDYIHNNNIIHRDLKPGNVMVGKELNGNRPKMIKIIDFGLARVKDIIELHDSDYVVGTFSYMPPEQSGIIKRAIDERSDLYSLGIMGFELLTHHLPFAATDIQSLMHMHVAQKPPPLGQYNKNIPLIIELMIHKLLEKDPDKRYQSARSLLYDLELYENGNLSFVPGQQDQTIKLHFQTNLIGREEELKFLRKHYMNTFKQQGKICLLGGEAGCGKTRLANELHSQMHNEKSLFLKTKCNSKENKTPYAPFIEILNEYLKYFQGYSHQRQEQIKVLLKEITEDFGELILQFNPALQSIIEVSRPTYNLAPDKELTRFLMVISRFLCLLSKIEGNMVLLLDDLQWADEDSMLLIQELLHQIEHYPFLILATYRNNEIEENEMLKQWIINQEEIATLSHLSLSPLSKESTDLLIKELILETDSNPPDIVDFIFLKSQGSPFFIIEILKQILEENALYFENTTWKIRSEKLKKIQLSSSIIELLLKRILSLSAEEQDLLTFAAVMGFSFDTNLLLSSIDMDQEMAISHLDNTVKLQLLTQDYYKKGRLCFFHDRIREAFYNNIHPSSRKRIHHQIAQNLEKIYQKELEAATEASKSTNSIIYDLAYHYIQEKNERKILIYAYKAGISAKNQFAYEEALKYLLKVSEILQKEEYFDQEKRLIIQQALGDIYLTIGKYKEAIQIYKSVLNETKDRPSQAKAHMQLSRAYLKLANYKQCEHHSKIGLSLLGEKLPVSRIMVFLLIFKELLLYFLFTLFPKSQKTLSNKNNGTNKNKTILMVQFLEITTWNYLFTDSYKFVRSCIRMLNLSQRRIGFSKELAISLVGFASLLMSIPLFKLSLRYYTKAEHIAIVLKDDYVLGQLYQMMGYNYMWQGQYKKSLQYFKQSVSLFVTLGDIREQSISLSGLGLVSSYLGDYYQAMETNNEILRIAERSNDAYGKCIYYYQSLIVHFEQGNYNLSLLMGNKGLDIAKENNLLFALCNISLEYSNVLLHIGDYDQSIKYLQQAQKLIKENRFLKHYNIHYPLYYAQWVIMNLENKEKSKNNSIEETSIEKGNRQKKVGAFIEVLKSSMKKQQNSKELQQIHSSLKKMKRIVKTWNLKKAETHRLLAKYYYLNGNMRHTKSNYNDCIRISSLMGLRYDLGRGLYDYSHFLEQINHYEEAQTRLKSAYRVFREIESYAYLQMIESQMCQSDEDNDSAARFMDRQRISAILQLSRDISSILNLEELIKNLLNRAMQVIGAQRGYVFILEEGTQLLKLRFSIDIQGNTPEEYSKDIVHKVFKAGEPLITSNAQQEIQFQNNDSVELYGLKSILCIPIKKRTQTMGVFYLDNPLFGGVFTEEDLHLLEILSAQAGVAIENASLYQNLEEKVKQRTQEVQAAYEQIQEAHSRLNLTYEELETTYRVIKEDLTLAKRIQQTLLPDNLTLVKELNIQVEYHPMVDVGGDIYDITLLPDNTVRIFLADAIGHGVQAALVTVIIHSEYNKYKDTNLSPDQIISKMNDYFVQSFFSATILFTGILIDINPNLKTLSYCSAGHPNQYLIQNNALIDLKRSGRIVGAQPDSHYQSNTLDFHPGDKILLFTDGVFEEDNPQKELYGEERLKRTIEKFIPNSIEQILKSLFSDLLAFMQLDHVSKNDDVTMLGIEFLSE